MSIDQAERDLARVSMDDILTQIERVKRSVERRQWLFTEAPSHFDHGVCSTLNEIAEEAFHINQTHLIKMVKQYETQENKL